VICRGVEQRRIMLDDLDRQAWFKLLVDVERRYRWKIHTWCLLDNHFHLLVEGTQPDLSSGMQRLNGVYAMRFNRRNKPRRASLSRTVRDARDRGREPPRDGDGVHLRERDPRRTARLAVAGPGLAARGLCWNG
jgi:REP element-mobilizing transposase RayT